nr:hypothetical protein [Tanacetum cinerariifolium]
MESKNDTIVAAVDVLMKNERIVDDVQAVDDVVSYHEKAVDNVVTTYYAGKIKLAEKIKNSRKIKIAEKSEAPLKPPLRCDPDSTT